MRFSVSNPPHGRASAGAWADRWRQKFRTDNPQGVNAGTAGASECTDAQTNARGGLSFYLRLRGGQARCPGLTARDFGQFGGAARTGTKGVFDTLNAGNG